MLMGIANPMPCAPPPRMAVLIADDLAAQVEQRAARVARVDRRVGLQEIVVAARVERHVLLRAALGADDAGAHRVREAERIADRDDPVAHVDRVRVAEGQRAQVLRVDAHDGDVRLRVGADDLAGELALVGELDLDRVGPLDDVVVREDDAALVDDEARAQPLHLAAAAAGG